VKVNASKGIIQSVGDVGVDGSTQAKKVTVLYTRTWVRINGGTERIRARYVLKLANILVLLYCNPIAVLMSCAIKLYAVFEAVAGTMGIE
jgi:hypothetical protein